MKAKIIFICCLTGGALAHADPILSSWYTQNSTVLARVIQSGTLTTPVTTWPSAGVTNNNNGSTAQTLPAYADVQRIRYTTTDVYINSSGLASHTMGPWYANATGNILFGFWPISQNYTVRITRSPSPAATKAAHGGGMIGMMVNGVAIYDLGDAFSFKQTSSSPVTGTDQMGASGGGVWYRDALAVEVVTFDPGYAHQPGINGQYHYHAEPKALRYQLGDNMRATYNSSSNTYSYTEDTSNLHHSPILGWSFDGYPIYGPYGYTSAMNAGSGVSRMRSGFVLRNGQNGTTNLDSSGRTTLPKWAAAAQGVSNPGNTNPVALSATQYGPTTTYQTSGPGGVTTYTLGRYSDDYDYLGDLGYTQGPSPGGAFDLDQYNGRTCVTPEYPGGIYAYFVTIDASGNPAFPYMLGKQYYGTKNGTGGATVPVSGVTDYFYGGPNLSETWSGSPGVNAGTGNVILTWSSVEGGTYKVEASDNLTSWTTIAPSVSATANSTLTSTTESGAALPANHTRRFYKVTRIGLASYTQ